MSARRSYFQALSGILTAFCLSAIFLGCEGPQFIDKPDLDCSTRLPEHGDPAWSCRKASEYAGRCIPAADYSSWGCLELDADARLCSAAEEEDPAQGTEPFRLSVYLTTSRVSFDCQDRVIDHGRSAGLSPKRPGFRTPYSRSVSDVTLQGCTVRDVGAYGVDLKRYFRGEELDGPMTGHQRISIKRFRISDTGQIGIYVGQNSEETVIEDTSIARAYIGIYLEAGSVRGRITRARVEASREREGLAVDSSEYNLIENSVFVRNGPDHRAINFYKNCGEWKGQICPVPRKLTSGHNIIRGNRFENDTVTVASRQFKRDIGEHCEGIDGFEGFWRDHSPDNLFHDNEFLDGSDLVVQDSPIVIHDNRFATGNLGLGKGSPVGHDEILLEGEVFRNRFEGSSHLQPGSVDSRVYKGLKIHDNVFTDHL